MKSYLFTSQRLGFRTWLQDDIDALAAINADNVVMEFFPSVQTREQTAAFILRMQAMYEQRGYCYYAVDTLHDAAFIGFTGLAWQEYEAHFTPCVDIGWRLAAGAWGKGYATEAATRCLHHGRRELGLGPILSVAPRANVPSIRVMQKAGLSYVQDFTHPLLKGNLRLERCVLYST